MYMLELGMEVSLLIGIYNGSIIIKVRYGWWNPTPMSFVTSESTSFFYKFDSAIIYFQRILSSFKNRPLHFEFHEIRINDSRYRTLQITEILLIQWRKLRTVSGGGVLEQKVSGLWAAV